MPGMSTCLRFSVMYDKYYMTRKPVSLSELHTGAQCSRYSLLSLSQHRLFRMTAYFETEIRSRFNMEISKQIIKYCG